MSSSALCLACGLCCQGLLHSNAVLDASEIRSALESGLEYFQKTTGEHLFRLPCTAYRNDCCAIYPVHPKACQRYRCKLLIGYSEGRTTFDSALEIIKRTKTHIEFIKNQLPDYDSTNSFWQQVQRQSGLDSINNSAIASNNANREILLHLAVLRTLLLRHFQIEKPSTGSSEP